MAASRRDYYEILEVEPSATAQEIRRAYRRLARRYHPDVNSGVGARTRFDEISAAYEVLHAPDQRASYDEQLEPTPRRASTYLSVVVVWHFPWPPRISFSRHTR
jgi:curved DNA-binding protein CbpA